MLLTIGRVFVSCIINAQHAGILNAKEWCGHVISKVKELYWNRVVASSNGKDVEASANISVSAEFFLEIIVDVMTIAEEFIKSKVSYYISNGKKA